uniref:Uncharacterized protein n=1 Tax=Arundo donax TaxID=35708 RepID=A0A0A9HRW0_ARUDO
MSQITVTNFVGATSGFALIGAFLSDSYITRSRTILLFGPLEFLAFFKSMNTICKSFFTPCISI